MAAAIVACGLSFFPKRLWVKHQIVDPAYDRLNQGIS
jgi:hypothetical protein